MDDRHGPAIRPFVAPERVQTERLVLRPFRADDLEALAPVYADPEVCRYLYWGPRTREETRATLEAKIAAGRALEREGDRVSFAATLLTSGELVADVGLTVTSLGHAQGEVGYTVNPTHRGRGYAAEAVAPLLAIAFAGVGLHRVVGRLEARNAASARVLEKLGMRPEAHLVENEWVRGEWQSEIVYAVLASEWRAGAGRFAVGG